MDAHLVTLLVDAIGAVVKGDLGGALSYVERAHKALSGQQTLPGMPAVTYAVTQDRDREVVTRLFTFWQVECNHKTAKPTPERMRAIGARLREGYTESEVRKAIEGAAVGAYVSADNGNRYDDLTLICRNGSKLEDFIQRGVKATGEILPQLVVSTASNTAEEDIVALRRRMSQLKAEGRTTEYESCEADLRRLMAARKR